MKQALKIIGSLIIGAALGFGISTLFIILTTDLTFEEFIGKFGNVELLEMGGVILFSVLSFLVAIVVHVLFHEGGHLIAGLLTGYRFVSFRIFNFTLLKSGGKLCIKRFKIAGTRGQCLLAPPEKPLEQIDAVWYNAGGFLANLLLSGGALCGLFFVGGPLAKTFLFIFALTGIFFALLNGIPFKVGGMPNDGYNMKMLRHNLESKKAMCTQLSVNALVQEGVRPNAMPSEWFTTPQGDDFNWKDPLQLSIRLMEASYIMDCGDMEKSHQMLEEAYSHKESIAPLFVNEIVCELIYTSLATGLTERARELYTKEIQTYISQHRKVMSSKERVMFAIKLLMEGDPAGAREIMDSVSSRQNEYLMQGEVKMDLSLMGQLILGPSQKSGGI